ncbi:MAG TPA: hypothetical protein VL202_24810 [Pararhizobium sp.]|uniref:hypothetical protein n=1 Tax=Pararhizobium sp. TaxID=1977563 RepID=UPI002CB279D4|nr:hypothetical protein [Pararhizobium sp.]HTO34363.1 hypothetical protein [Pararhizobium sp.]
MAFSRIANRRLHTPNKRRRIRSGTSAFAETLCPPGNPKVNSLDEIRTFTPPE